jgi:hypothetical protein
MCISQLVSYNFIGRIKHLDAIENGDYSSIDLDFSILDAEPYDLLLIGMPAYGSEPPKTFLEIIKRMNQIVGKQIVLFGTSRFRRGSQVQFMKEQVEAKGADVIGYCNFRGLILLGKRNAQEFGRMINEL